MVGRVVRNKQDKTVIVEVESRRRHPLYRRIVRRVTRFMVHDEQNQCRVGDTIRIVESRPLSRRKRWRLQEILARHEVAEVKPVELDKELTEGAEEAE
jgi:small subunit ribosomal protein S17